MGKSNLLFESIFNRKLSDKDTRDYLTQVTKDHPYFSPAQFFLLSQSEKGTADYAKQVAKTSLLFNNAYWLNFCLEEAERNNNNLVPAPINDHFTELIIHPIQEIASLENDQITEIFEADNSNDEAPAEINENIPFNEPNFETTTENRVDLNTVAEAETIIEATIIPEEMADKEVKKNPIEEFQLTAMPEAPDEIIIEEELNAEDNTTEIINQQEEQPAKTALHHATHFNNEESPLVNETEEEGIILDEEIEPMKFRLNIDTQNITEDTISFEPLHTSDYFASLGIKLSNEIQPNDKLGKQLKSFTEWLKTMKKIHSDQLPQQTAQAEITIQKLAENSNKEGEVVTESMAEVLVQQGKVKKALEVYKKLSLLDSTKSAYFAAKIDQLKEH